MKKKLNREYYIIDPDPVIKQVTEACKEPCNAAKLPPKVAVEYSTQTKPTGPGTHTNFDVIKDWGRNVAVIRDNYSSLVATCPMKNETKEEFNIVMSDSFALLQSYSSISTCQHLNSCSRV